MYPPLLMMHAEMSKRLIATRFRTIAAAADNANRTGYCGLRYAWESAFTGKFIPMSHENHQSDDFLLLGNGCASYGILIEIICPFLSKL